MVMRIQWSVELVTGIKIVPRLEDHLIDELFYQEDEIGEMRHTAFMVDCGLEEDPPDGPNVAPVPWGDMLLKLQDRDRVNDGANGIAGGNENDEGLNRKRRQRELPSRSQSTDNIDNLTIKVTSLPQGRQNLHLPSIPRRCNSINAGMRPSSLFVKEKLSPKQSPATTVSKLRVGSARSRRSEKAPKKHPPNKAASNDNIRNMGLSLSFAKTERPSPLSPNIQTKRSISSRSKREFRVGERQRGHPPVNRLLCKTSSGTSHDMGIDAAKIRAITDNTKQNQKPPIIRSLMAAKSGTLHGMRKKLPIPKKGSYSQREHSKNNINLPQNNSEDKEEISSIVYKNGKRLSRPLNSKRDKKEKVSIVFKNGKKTITREPCSNSSSDDDFLDDIVSSDDNTTTSSVISISTCGSMTDDSPIIQQMDPVPRIITSSPVSSPPSLALTKKRRSLSKNKTTNNGSLLGEKKYPTVSSASTEEKKTSKFLNGSISSSSSQPAKKSSVKTKKKKKKKKKSDGLENEKGTCASVSSSSSKIKFKKNSLLSETKTNSPSIDIQRHDRELTHKPHGFLPGSDLCTASHKVTKKEKVKSNHSKASNTSRRSDDWLGSAEKSKRSWRAKTKKKMDVLGDNR